MEQAKIGAVLSAALRQHGMGRQRADNGTWGAPSWGHQRTAQRSHPTGHIVIFGKSPAETPNIAHKKVGAVVNTGYNDRDVVMAQLFGHAGSAGKEYIVSLGRLVDYLGQLPSIYRFMGKQMHLNFMSREGCQWIELTPEGIAANQL